MLVIEIAAGIVLGAIILVFLPLILEAALWILAILAGLAVFLFLVFLTVPAHAACRWTWDCPSMGVGCRQIQVCDNALDVRVLRPMQVAPVPAPSVRPIPQMTLPPLGTSSCRQAYLCNGSGECRWQSVCR